MAVQEEKERMLTSAIGKNNMIHKNKGFTLIELLIVVVIISVIISVTLITQVSDRSQTKAGTLSHELFYLLNMAAEDALLNDNELGFSVINSQFHWWHWNRETEKWDTYKTNNFQTKSVTSGITVIIETPKNQQQQNNNIPEIIFYSDGSITKSNITIFSQNSRTEKEILESDGAKVFVK